MALAAPTNLVATFHARPNMENAIVLTWTAVAGAVAYKVHKNDDRTTFADTTGYEEIHDVTTARFEDTISEGVMDVFYYVTAVDAAGEEGTPSGTITSIDPWLERIIEYVDSNIGDDFTLNIYVMTPFQKKLAIDQALHYVNSEPPGTDYNYVNYPRRWLHLLAFGGSAFALKRQMILEKAKEMAVNDQGIGWQPPPMSDVLRVAAENWEKLFVEHTEKVKRNHRPQPRGLGSMQTAAVAPTILKFRHLKSGRVI